MELSKKEIRILWAVVSFALNEILSILTSYSDFRGSISDIKDFDWNKAIREVSSPLDKEQLRYARKVYRNIQESGFIIK